MASKLDIQVMFTMPESSAACLRETVTKGGSGIQEITSSLSCVDSERAVAWNPEDEVKVKSLIQETVGFGHVNRHVTKVMITWVGEVIKAHIQDLIDAAHGVPRPQAIEKQSEGGVRKQKSGCWPPLIVLPSV